jgi:hypothetical protein
MIYKLLTESPVLLAATPVLRTLWLLTVLRERDFKYALVWLACWRLWCARMCCKHKREIYQRSRDREQPAQKTSQDGKS